MRKPVNPLHAAAWGVMAGFAIFATMVVQSGTWWPNAALSERGMTILGLFTGTFAGAALTQNWATERR
jgi:hypothetical protein